MAINSTGVVILDRETNREFAFHDHCWLIFEKKVGEASKRLVPMGPMFGDDWICPNCTSRD